MRYLEGDEYTKAFDFLKIAADIARKSTCFRSKCGSVISSNYDFNNDVIGSGWNSPPQGKILDSCLKDSLPCDFKSDKTCCVHAEQRAIADALLRSALKYGINASNSLIESTIYFVRLDENNNIKPSGDPYCTICSKFCLDNGISEFVMMNKNGIVSYPMEEFNELSFKYKNS